MHGHSNSKTCDLSKHMNVRTTLTAGCLLLLVSACAPHSVPADRMAADRAPAAAARTVSIVGTNDLHGGVLARNGRGGLALLGGYVKNLRAARARDGGAVLLIDAGDMFQGTLESNLGEGRGGRRRPTTSSATRPRRSATTSSTSARSAGGDAADAGRRSARRAEGAGGGGALPVPRREPDRRPRAARRRRWTNVRPTDAGRGGRHQGRHRRRDDAAARLTATIAGNVGGLSVAPLVDTIRDARDRAAGAGRRRRHRHRPRRRPLHRRFDRPDDLSSCEPASEILDVARGLPRGLVDVIVAGHTHAAMAHQVEGIAITEAYSNGRAFGRVDLSIDRRTRTVVGRRSFPPRDLCEREDPATKTCGPRSDAALVRPNTKARRSMPDAAVERVLAPALEQVRVLKAQPIGIVLETPIRRLLPASPLGNLVTDALPRGGARRGRRGEQLRRRPARRSAGRAADLRRRVRGDAVRQSRRADSAHRAAAAPGVRDHPAGSRRVIGFSGIRVRAQCAAGSLEVVLLRPSGTPIRDDEPLLVAISDFLATGGDGLLASVTPSGGFLLPDTAPLARDVLADYLSRLGGHLREAALLDSGTPRLSVPGELPVNCPGP